MGWQDGEWWEAHTTQGFKWNATHTAAHSGEDFGMPVGTPIASPNPGTIRDAQWEPWGYQVDEVTNIPGMGVVTESYLHLSEIAVHPGDIVGPGSIVGKSGTPPSSQYGNGPHLHFELTSGAASPYLDYSPHNPTDSTHPVDPSGFVNVLRGATGGIGLLGGGVDPTAIGQGIVGALTGAITAPFKAMGVDSLEDFFWRTSLIGLGMVLIVYALFKLFQPGLTTAVNVVSAVGKAGAVAA